MKVDEINALDGLFTKALKILELISKSEVLIYFVGLVALLIFIYAFTRMILDFKSGKRVDDALDKNNQMLGEVRNALMAFVTRNN